MNTDELRMWVCSIQILCECWYCLLASWSRRYWNCCCFCLYDDSNHEVDYNFAMNQAVIFTLDRNCSLSVQDISWSCTGLILMFVFLFCCFWCLWICLEIFDSNRIWHSLQFRDMLRMLGSCLNDLCVTLRMQVGAPWWTIILAFVPLLCSTYMVMLFRVGASRCGWMIRRWVMICNCPPTSVFLNHSRCAVM